MSALNNNHASLMLSYSLVFLLLGGLESHAKSIFRQHLFQDLEPYICTHEVCPTGGQLFSKKHDWINHERSCHRLQWFCPMESCLARAVQFSSRELLRSHVTRMHLEYFSESQMSAVLNSSIRHCFLAADCPFCGWTFTNETQYDCHVSDE